MRVKKIWIDGKYENLAGWRWENHFQRFTGKLSFKTSNRDNLNLQFHIRCPVFKRILLILDYTNWEGGIDNPPLGCKSSGCGIYDGIVARPDAKMTWNAHDKASVLPFICLSKCRYGYKWYDGK